MLDEAGFPTSFSHQDVFIGTEYPPSDLEEFARTASSVLPNMPPALPDCDSNKENVHPDEVEDYTVHDDNDRLTATVKDVVKEKSTLYRAMAITETGSDGREMIENGASYTSRRLATPESSVSSRPAQIEQTSELDSDVDLDSTAVQQYESDVNDHDDANDEHTPVKMPPSKQRKKRKIDIEHTPCAPRTLRDRKPFQEKPYSAEVLTRDMQKSKGRKPTEAELQQAFSGTKTTAKKLRKIKKVPARGSRSVSVHSNATSTVDTSTKLEDSQKLQYTLIRVLFPGNNGSVERPLNSLSNLGDLMEFVEARKPKKSSPTSHLICRRPWMGNDYSLRIQADWDDQYDALVASVLKADVWESNGDQELEVIVEVKQEEDEER